MFARAFLVMLLCLVLFFGACSKKDEAAPKSETTAKAASAPQFPSDIPIYPFSQKLEIQREGGDARATFVTTSDVDAVVNYYRNEMVKWGWEKIGHKEQKDRVGDIFKKGNRVFHVIVREDQESEYSYVTLIVNG